MWHLSLFEPIELLQIAVEMEKRGYAFYQAQAGKATDSAVRDLLLGLAAEEEKHQSEFAALGEDLEEANLRETYPGEYLDYLGSLLETHVFNDLGYFESSTTKRLTEKDVLQLAARLEKDTILFFYSMSRVVKPEKQSLIAELIAQEEGHLARINRLLRER
ncbi:MAG: ferritin-like domain-containing protein [Bacillota bacterium]